MNEDRLQTEIQELLDLAGQQSAVEGRSLQRENAGRCAGSYGCSVAYSPALDDVAKLVLGGGLAAAGWQALSHHLNAKKATEDADTEDAGKEE